MPKRGGWTLGPGGGGGGRKDRSIGKMPVNAAAKEERRGQLLKAGNKENSVPPVVGTEKKTKMPLQAVNNSSNSNPRSVTAETKKKASTPLLLDNSSNNKSNDQLALVVLTETKNPGETEPFPVFDANDAFPLVTQKESLVAGTVVEQVHSKKDNVELIVPLDKKDGENNDGNKAKEMLAKETPEKLTWMATGTLKRHADDTTTTAAAVSKPRAKKPYCEDPHQAEIRKGQLLSFTRWWRRTTMIVAGSTTLDDTISRTPMAFVFNEATGPNYVVGAIWCTTTDANMMEEATVLPYAWMEIDYSVGTVVRQGGSTPLVEGGFLDSLKIKLLATMDCDDIPVVASMADWKDSIVTNEVGAEGEPHSPVFLSHVPDWMYGLKVGSSCLEQGATVESEGKM